MSNEPRVTSSGGKDFRPPDADLDPYQPEAFMMMAHMDHLAFAGTGS
ncbi:hypothetical protein AB3G45_03200 [Shinella sp. S4-D37]